MNKNPYEVLGYFGMGGYNDCPLPAEQIVVAKYWYEKYGAVPAGITYDEIEFYVEKPVQTLEEAKKVAEWITYPVMIKATAGGGGKGMRIARDEKELAENYIVAQNEAKANFGNPDVYIEKYVEELGDI